MFMYYFMIALCIAFLILLIRVPIIIAKRRGIIGGNLVTIAILSWLGLLLGITWIIALILSLVWSGGGESIARELANLEKLERLNKLKKSGAITQREYDSQKKKILG